MTLRDQVLAAMDDLGIIGQPDYRGISDIAGGDSINRMAHYHFLIEANKKIGNNIADLANLPFSSLESYRESLEMFECPNSPGNYRRHPTDPGNTYCNGTYDGIMSRDQTMPLLITLGFFAMYHRLGMYFLRHAMRLFLFTTNTRGIVVNPGEYKKKIPDITGPMTWSTYLRGVPAIGYLLYPVLCVLDLELLIGAYIWKKYRQDDNDIINYATMLIYANLQVRTPVSYLATKVISRKLVMGKLKDYWCGWRNTCFYVDLYEPLITRILK